MKSVYVVFRGEYDDYEIVAVFSTRKKAEAFFKTKNMSGFIREYQLN